MRWSVLGLLLFLAWLPLAAQAPAVKNTPPPTRPPVAEDRRDKPGGSPAPGSPAIRVAAVQMRSGRDLDANIKHAIELLRQCKADGVQVAVFPECSLSGYFTDVILQLSAGQLAGAEREVANACRELEINAVIGSPVRDGDKLYNSALVITSAGKVIERYHKVQLAESWPHPGDHLSIFPIAGVPCTAIVCHDERYPELVRLPVLAGARVVFYLSHESPLRQEHKLGPYRAQIQARAVENSVFVVHANAPANLDATGSHGQSRLIDPEGNLIKEATFFGEEILTATLDLRKATAANALRGISRGPLGDWWKEGLKHVRRID